MWDHEPGSGTGKGNSRASGRGEGHHGSPCTRVRQNIVRSAGRDVSCGGMRRGQVGSLGALSN